MEIKPGGGKHGVLVAAAGDDDVESLPTPVSPMPPEMPPLSFDECTGRYF